MMGMPMAQPLRTSSPLSGMNQRLKSWYRRSARTLRDALEPLKAYMTSQRSSNGFLIQRRIRPLGATMRLLLRYIRQILDDLLEFIRCYWSRSLEPHGPTRSFRRSHAAELLQVHL